MVQEPRPRRAFLTRFARWYCALHQHHKQLRVPVLAVQCATESHPIYHKRQQSAHKNCTFMNHSTHYLIVVVWNFFWKFTHVEVIWWRMWEYIKWEDCLQYSHLRIYNIAPQVRIENWSCIANENTGMIRNRIKTQCEGDFRLSLQFQPPNSMYFIALHQHGPRAAPAAGFF